MPVEKRGVKALQVEKQRNIKLKIICCMFHVGVLLTDHIWLSDHETDNVAWHHDNMF